MKVACHTEKIVTDLASQAIAAILVVTVLVSKAISRHYDRVAGHATSQRLSMMAKTGHD